MSASCSAAAAKIKKSSRLRPTLGLVLGSGFGHVLEAMDVDARIPYATLPGFPRVSVSGHAGELYVGRIAGVPVVALSGRSHFYEGHGMADVTFAMRLLAELGIRDVLLTNAAGGVNRRFKVGDLMVVTDHINFMGVNPLRPTQVKRMDPGDKLPQFVDLTRVYDPDLSGLLDQAGRATKVKLRHGIYLAVSGPSYETPAEIRAFARLGADAVGMSTVPEAIAARQCGVRVAALSCITNLAAGISAGPLSHSEVLATAGQVKATAAKLLQQFMQFYADCR